MKRASVCQPQPEKPPSILAASKATKIVRKHHALRSITQSAAELHDWNEKHPDQHFSLNVLNINSLSVDPDEDTP